MLSKILADKMASSHATASFVKPIEVNRYPDLIKLVNETYTDRVDRILSGEVDGDGNIICIAQDGNKQLDIKITNDDIEIKLFNSTTQFQPPEDDPIEPILSQLKPIGDATFTEWFTTLQSLMQESENLVEFRDKLTESYPDLDAAEFKQAMLDASVVAGMKGYDDAASIESSFSYTKIPEGTIKGDKILHNSRWHLADTKDLLEQNKDTYDFHLENIPTLEDGKDLPPELVKSAAEYLTLTAAYSELYGDNQDKLFEKLEEVNQRFSDSFYDAVDDDIEDEEFDRVQNMLDTLMRAVGF